MKHALTVVVLSLLLCPHVGTAADALENIPLKWKQTSKIKPPATMANVVDSLTVEMLTDARKTRELIAENREGADKGRAPKRVTTNDNVPAFVTDGLSKSLEQAGFTVKPGAERSIGGELRQFFVVETGTYKGDVSLRLWIKNRQGQTLWTGVVNAGSTRWGKSYKAENYYEVLSDSLINAVNKLMENPEALKALTKR